MSKPDLPSFAESPENQVTDLLGDPCGAGLIIFMNGNQWMAVPDLLQAFETEQVIPGGVFVETLPPGLLEAQLRQQGLRFGSLILRVRPDLLTSGLDDLQRLAREGLVEEPVHYAENRLALLVTASAYERLSTLADLGDPEVRVALPNPATEGVGRLVLRALAAAGGERLVRRVQHDKLTGGTTRLTVIHHRQSPRWLEEGVVDAAPLWASEAEYHERRTHGRLRVRELAAEVNQVGRYGVALVRASNHRNAAVDFMAFLRGATAQSIYRRYGFAAMPGD